MPLVAPFLSLVPSFLIKIREEICFIIATDDRDLHERVAKRNTEGCKRKGGQRKERKETDRGRASVHGKALFSVETYWKNQ